jgi:hypothetical protein
VLVRFLHFLFASATTAILVAAFSKPSQAENGSCTPVETLRRQGFVLTAQSGRRIEVKPSTGEVVISEISMNGSTTTFYYHQGLYLLRAVGPGGETNMTYDFDYAQEPAPAVGNSRTFHSTMRTPDGKTSTVTSVNKIVGKETVRIGGCAFETFVLEGLTTGPGNPIARRSNFDPVLRFFLRSTIQFEGAAPVTTVYDRIAPLP